MNFLRGTVPTDFFFFNCFNSRTSPGPDKGNLHSQVGKLHPVVLTQRCKLHIGDVGLIYTMDMNRKISTV